MDSNLVAMKSYLKLRDIQYFADFKKLLKSKGFTYMLLCLSFLYWLDHAT